MSTPEETTAPVQPDQAPSHKEVDDANDLRGHHFKRLMGKRLTWLVGGVPTVAIAIGLGVFGNPVWLPIILILGSLIVLIVVFLIATSKAKQDFFQLYAQQRGMTLGGRTSLPGSTPLLRKGDDQYAEHTFTGALADGVDGILALYTYEDETTDSDGNRQTSYYHYTLGLIEVPECVELVPELYCQRKFGFRALEKFEDVFRGSKDRVKFESEALDKKYEIFADEKQDQNWLRQLFSPTFIVWLTDEAPKKFGFELVNGTLCCYVDGHKDSAEDLDMVRAASAAVAIRLREEANE